MSGAPHPAARPALAPGLAAFVEHLRVQRRLAPRTLAMYTLALERLARMAAGDGVPLEQAGPQHLRLWLVRYRAGESALAGAGERARKGDGATAGTELGPRSLAIALAAWRGLYRWWGAQGRVQADPLAGLRPPKAAHRLPKALNVEQAQALAEQAVAASGRATGRAGDRALAARDCAIVELLYGGGLRIAELRGLDLHASDRAAGWVEFEPEGGATAHVLGKGSKRRSVPLGAPAAQALRQWIALRPELLPPGRGDEPALFVSRLGRRLSPGPLRERLRRGAQQAGVAVPVHPHMLRHSFASHVLQSSGDLRAVQELMGHASIASTQVYTRLDFQHLARAYDQAHPRAKRRK
jgi:integrase/recombinase XerC